MNEIQNSILQTLHWFEILRRPLIAAELYLNLWKCACSQEDFQKELQELIDEGIVYRVSDPRVNSHEYILRSQPEAHEVWENYVNRAPDRRFFEEQILKLQRVLRFVPLLDSVYVVNSVAFGGIRKGSDLDLFIVIRDGYMWLGRVLVTLVVSCMGIRRHGKKIANRVCLSFFVTQSHMDLEQIRIKDHDDIYLTYWVLWGRPLIIDRFSFMTFGGLVASNFWVKEYVPNAFDSSPLYRLMPMTRFAKAIEDLLVYSGVGAIVDEILRFFLKRRAWYKHKKSTSKASIVISDTMLKFHEEDRREEHWEKFSRKN